MIREFSGKTEKEAIDNAVRELGIDREEFDVEIVEASKKGFLFRKGAVKIRVHLEDLPQRSAPMSETEKKLSHFIEELMAKMDYPGNVSVLSSHRDKIVFDIKSDHSGILIGKRGKNLDAIQLLANVYAGRIGENSKIIIDSEGYRQRREQSLIRLAIKTADQVRRNKGSRLLEPMNPFERRLIHTTLNTMGDIDTKSEGQGLIKQVRISLKR